MKKLILILLPFLILTGCSKDEIAPMPQASFFASSELIEANETVSFTNNSTQALRYEWDFGNGQFTTVQNPTMQYARPGTYTVTLSAYNKDNNVQVSRKTIRVGDRYLKHFVIREIPFLDPNGLAWDSDGSGPDIFFYIARSSSSNWEYNTLVQPELKKAQLPITLAVQQTNIMLTDENWQFALYDQDSFNNEIMSSWEFNPKTYGQNRIIRMTGTEYNIELHYEIR